jgi:hypothetical protein
VGNPLSLSLSRTHLHQCMLCAEFWQVDRQNRWIQCTVSPHRPPRYWCMAGCIACDANVLQRDQFARFCYESVRVTGDSASLTSPHTPTGRRPQASANRSAICYSLGALPQTPQPQEMPINAQCTAPVPCAISSCVGGCLPERVADTSEWQHCDAQHATDPRAIRKLERRQRQNNGHPVVHNTTGASQPRTARSEAIISWRDTLAYSMQQASANQNDRRGRAMPCHLQAQVTVSREVRGTRTQSASAACSNTCARPPASGLRSTRCAQCMRLGTFLAAAVRGRSRRVYSSNDHHRHACRCRMRSKRRLRLRISAAWAPERLLC